MMKFTFAALVLVASSMISLAQTKPAAATAEIREVAQSQGMKSLRQNALQKVLDGVTTVEEVLRVTLG